MSKLFTPRLSIYQKFGLLISLILVVFSGLIYFNQQDQIIERNKLQMESHLQDITNLFDLQLKEKQEQVNSALAVAHHLFTSSGPLREVETAQQEVLAINQITKEEHQVKLNTWYIGDKQVLNNFEIVDQIQQLTEQTATIFQKIDEGYLRISTNVRKLDGQRAVGTFIPNSSEIVKTVESGKTYRGRAFVVSSWYVTAYEPIYVNGQVKGMLYVGVQEKDLGFLKKKFYEKSYYTSGYPYAITNEGEFLLHKTREGEKVADQEYGRQILENKEGMLNIPWGGEKGQKMLHFLKSYDFYGITLGIAVPEEEILSQPLYKLRIIIIGGFFISLSLMLLLVHATARSVVMPLKKVNEILKLLAQRKPVRLEQTNRVDEVGEINSSLAQLADGLAQISVFVTEIGKGNFEASFSTLGNEDVLGKALLQMRHDLKKAATDDKIRQWANEGYTMFSDILRENNHSLELLTDQSLRSLIKYLSANQGALYIAGESSEEEAYMEIAACYAWNKKKYLHQKIWKGEGLAGQVWLEGDSLFLTDIPNEYINIQSGLGGASPTCVLIVPLKNNEAILGVLEIASFQVFQEYEIKFVEKVAESLGAALNTANINELTRKLLENSQQHTEELRAAEEEMRQNMEELEATQEEMHRKEVEMRSQISYVANSLATAEFDMQGNLLTANENLLALMECSLEELKGKPHHMFCKNTYADSNAYEHFWQQLSSGLSLAGELSYQTKSTTKIRLYTHYNPILDETGKPYKVVALAFRMNQQNQVGVPA